jgi:hypothetical protein
VAALLLLTASGSEAQSAGQDVERNGDASAVEAGTFLLVPVGARSIGMGGAVTSSKADIEGSLWNPSSLAGLEGSAVYLMGGEDFAASSRVLGGVVAIGKLRGGLTILHYDLGTVDGRDEGNNPLGTIDPSQTAFVLSAAYPLLAWLDLGASGKLLRLSASCSFACDALEETSTGFAFDFGAIGTFARQGALRVGLLLRNLGPGLEVAGGPADPLPARARLGVEADLPAVFSDRGSWAGGELSLLVRSDLQQTLAEFDDFDAHVGAELSWRRLLMIRGGYSASTEGRSGPTLGLGFRYGGLLLDMGYVFNDFARYDSGTPLQLSVGYEF